MHHDGTSDLMGTQLQFQCLDYIVQSPRLHYMRFAISPILSGQANLIATTIRRALLRKIQGACISSAHFVGAVHQYSTLPGIRESIHNILLNLREVVVQTDTHEPQTGYISFQGPGRVTADCLELPPSVRVVDRTQHIAQVEQEVELKIEVTVTRAESTTPPRTDTESPLPFKDSVFLIDARLGPIKSVSYRVYSIGSGPRLQELLMFEIWTDGRVSPQQMLYDAACYWSSLLQPLLALDTGHRAMPSELNQSRPQHRARLSTDPTAPAGQIDTQLRLRGVSIDELQLPTRICMCLRRAGLHTVSQLASRSQEELLQLRQLGKDSVHLVATALRARFHIDLPVSHH